MWSFERSPFTHVFVYHSRRWCLSIIKLGSFSDHCQPNTITNYNVISQVTYAFSPWLFFVLNTRKWICSHFQTYLIFLFLFKIVQWADKWLHSTPSLGGSVQMFGMLKVLLMSLIHGVVYLNYNHCLCGCLPPHTSQVWPLTSDHHNLITLSLGPRNFIIIFLWYRDK